LKANPTVDFIYFEAGGGHKAAATALQAVMAAEGYEWDIRLVNLQEVLDPLDIFRKITRIRLQDIYNRMLAKGWTLGSVYLLPMMQAVIRLYHDASVHLLVDFWRSRAPDMVVSLVPNLNRALFESLQKALPGTPFVTILTDLADYPPHFWIEKQEQHFICGSERAMQQALAMGHDRQRVFRASGMILRPAFYEEPNVDRREERKRLGLDPDLPTGIVLFGGEGSNAMYRIAKALGNSARDLQIILICGRNARLRERLQQLHTKNPIFVEGFTKDIPRYMFLADFFIGKPGPGSISEALHLGLPVIVESNAWTLPQERFNAEWVREQKLGIVLPNFRHINRAVSELLSGNRLEEMRSRIRQMNNRAVYEIPPILEGILDRHRRNSQDRLLAQS
jgi:1,2-diacylglycerol 3-beta-galactosyltransferase